MKPASGPQPGVRVGEDAVQIAALLGEVVQRERQRQKADAHNEPCNEHRSRGGHAGQLTGDGEHARADARADHHADEPDKPNAFLFLFHTSIPSLAGSYTHERPVRSVSPCKGRPMATRPWRLRRLSPLTSRLAKTNALSSHGGGTRTVRMTYERSSLSPARTTMKEVN